MSEIMLIMILSMIWATVVTLIIEKVCKQMRHFFPYVVSYSHFVELEKEVVIPLAMFIKKVLLGKCTDIIFVDRTPLQERKNYRIHIHKAYSLAELQVLSRGRHLWFVVFQWFLLTVFTRFRQVHKKVTFCRAKGRLLKGEKPCLASRKAII